MSDRIIKYPRTPHIEGSRLGEGDEDLSQIPFSTIRGKLLAVEEKVDGANTAISFGEEGKLLLQSRGHFLMGGAREGQFSLFKLWATSKRDILYSLLGKRYIMYGEWMYAKHTVYYDALPHYFLEFDVFDKERGVFLDTEARRKILVGSPVISAPTLKLGRFSTKEELLSLLGKSSYITEGHLSALRKEAESLGLDPEAEIASVPHNLTMEGIYVKVEENGIVADRMKFVRRDFRQTQLLLGEDKHYKPIIKNKLRDDATNVMW